MVVGANGSPQIRRRGPSMYLYTISLDAQSNEDQDHGSTSEFALPVTSRSAVGTSREGATSLVPSVVVRSRHARSFPLGHRGSPEVSRTCPISRHSVRCSRQDNHSSHNRQNACADDHEENKASKPGVSTNPLVAWTVVVVAVMRWCSKVVGRVSSIGWPPKQGRR